MPTIPTQIPNVKSKSLKAASFQPLLILMPTVMFYSKPCDEARQIAANVAKLPDLLRGMELSHNLHGRFSK
jgi:hypothetical protein